jgi:hypothetical protein
MVKAELDSTRFRALVPSLSIDSADFLWEVMVDNKIPWLPGYGSFKSWLCREFRFDQSLEDLQRNYEFLGAEMEDLFPPGCSQCRKFIIAADKLKQRGYRVIHRIVEDEHTLTVYHGHPYVKPKS